MRKASFLVEDLKDLGNLKKLIACFKNHKL